MKLIPSSLQTLVSEFAKLPGVGERTGLRYAVSLIRDGNRRTEALKRALTLMEQEVSSCPTCYFWTQNNICPLCADQQRPASRLCVVRDSPDVIALEKFKAHPWKYHILQGLLSPLSGVGPGQIKLQSLFERIESQSVTEVILAVDATVEGDATALFIRDQLKERHPHVKLTRTALGLPAGASVEYLDSSTLEKALEHRTLFD